MIDEDYYQKLFNVILSTSNGLIIQTFNNYLKQCFLCEHVVESVVLTAVYLFTCIGLLGMCFNYSLHERIN